MWVFLKYSVDSVGTSPIRKFSQALCSQNALRTFSVPAAILDARLESFLHLYLTKKGEKQSCKSTLCLDFRCFLFILQIHIETKRILDLKQIKNVSML